MSLDAEDEYDFLQKVIIVGDTAVGKTCLLLRFCEDEFTPNFISTIGIDFQAKTFLVDQDRVRMQVWDTAGQERFRSITQTYYRGAGGIFLVYDVSNRDSFLNVKKWLANIQTNADPKVIIILLGNKSDAPDRQVPIEHGRELATASRTDFFETSAKTGFNVESAFLTMARKIRDRRQQEQTGRVALAGKDGGRRGCC